MTADTKTFRARRIDGSLALVAGAVLAVCIFYVIAYTYRAPYPGLDYDEQWQVLRLEDACPTLPEWCAANLGHIRVGDRLLQIGPLLYEAYASQGAITPFDGYQTGDVVPITLLRDGAQQETTWIFPGPSPVQRLLRLTGFLLMLPFWLAGTGVLLLLRPRDRRWLLIVLFNYLTGLWIAVGNFSILRIAASPVVLRTIALLMVPVYLHLHLLVPTPFRIRGRQQIVVLLYGLAVALAAWNLAAPLPKAVFNAASLAAVLGSLALLIVRAYVPAPASERLAVRLMLLGVGLGFGPGLVLWVIPTLLGSTTPGLIITAIMTIAMPLQPFFYVYTMYKQRLGNLEFRANWVLSLYGFILLFGTGYIIIFLTGNRSTTSTPQDMAFALGVSVGALVLGLWLRQPFQRFIDRLAYGTEHNPDTIVRTFANQIPRALDREALSRLLVGEVSPALMIRQSALYLFGAADPASLYADGVTPYVDADLGVQMQRLLATSRRYLPPELDVTAESAFAWVRLVVPIEMSGKTIAAWLLGKRDPDDYYPWPDIELLITLANQIGIALETARLFEDVQRRASELETAYRDLQRLDKLKDEFVQNVSHELRTPLTFLRGYVDLFLEELLGPLTGEQREALSTMSDRTEGIIRLVNDIISLQNARADETVHEPVNLVALAHSCVEAMEVATRRRAAGQPAHTFHVDVSEDIPHVMGDRRRLAQVFDNLLGNAVKFSPDGGAIRIQIACCAYKFSGNGHDDQPRPAVEIDVCDNGIGIPAGEVDRIWQRFYQVDGSSTRRFGGMGLGLAIVHGIVEAHGGNISVESHENQGSTFRIVLPVGVDAPVVAAPKNQLTA